MDGGREGADSDTERMGITGEGIDRFKEALNVQVL